MGLTVREGRWGPTRVPCGEGPTGAGRALYRPAPVLFLGFHYLSLLYGGSRLWATKRGPAVLA
jgi:hypothetical protein